MKIEEDRGRLFKHYENSSRKYCPLSPSLKATYLPLSTSNY